MKVDVLVAEIGSTTTVVNAFHGLDGDRPVYLAKAKPPLLYWTEMYVSACRAQSPTCAASWERSPWSTARCWPHPLPPAASR